MVLYICNICLKEFNHKGNYQTHINRKFKCKKIIIEKKEESNKGIIIPKQDSNNRCNYCNKIYSTISNLNKHLKICKVKKEENIKQELYNLLVKQNEEQKKENLYLKQQINLLQGQYKKISTKTINSNNNIKNINSNNNINIVAFNKTDLSHITDKDFEYIMKRCNMCIPNLIEKTHYDPNKPENKNIFISNIKDRYVMKWNGKKWNLNNREEALEDLYENSSNTLEDRIETWEYNKFQYDPIAVQKFYRFLDNKDKDKVKNKIKEEIKLILYNNRLKINN